MSGASPAGPVVPDPAPGDRVNPTGSVLPGWLQPLARAASRITAEQLSRVMPPEAGGRESAVLILLGDGPGGPEVLLLQRADRMRSHAGQPAFPGGAVDPGDADPVATAVREAAEETGLDPGGVHTFAALPRLWLPPSGFVVTPVLAWWRRPSPVHAAIPAEVAAVHRVTLSELADPGNRVRVQHPSGFVGPAFTVRGMVVWGFTAGLLDRLLEFGGWARPWDATRTVPLPGPALPPGGEQR